MQCPTCGGSSGGVLIVIGMVKVCTRHCKTCGRVWRHFVLVEEFHASRAEQEIHRLKEKAKTCKCTQYAIRFLRSMLEATSEKTLEQKRNDAWEKRYLKEIIGEDY